MKVSTLQDWLKNESPVLMAKMEKRKQRMNDEDKLYFKIFDVLEETDQDKTFLDECVCISMLRRTLHDVQEFLDEKTLGYSVTRLDEIQNLSDEQRDDLKSLIYKADAKPVPTSGDNPIDGIPL